MIQVHTKWWRRKVQWSLQGESSSVITCNSSFFKHVPKQENEEMDCPEPCVPERSPENPDIFEDAKRETQVKPHISQNVDPEVPCIEKPSQETAMPRYPRSVRKKPNRYQSRTYMDHGIITFSTN